jgi:hypothetical protein
MNYRDNVKDDLGNILGSVSKRGSTVVHIIVAQRVAQSAWKHLTKGWSHWRLHFNGYTL